MRNFQQFTAIIEREENQYVALCPELDIASQGNTIEEARFYNGATKRESCRDVKKDRIIDNYRTYSTT